MTCILTEAQLEKIVNVETIRLIREMVDVMPTGDLIKRKLRNTGVKYNLWQLFKNVQFNVH
jgi:hypothetical protein